MMVIQKTWYRIKTIKQRGRGIFVTRDIEAGTVIGDYLGTIIKPDSNDENKTGLYDMRGGEKYDIYGDPKKEGIHFINHSCANNCDAYPYRGHILYVTLRKVFAGEELTVDYGLGAAEEKNIVCYKHACHCGSKICTGTMHSDETQHDEWFEAWEKLVEKNAGSAARKMPGKFGDRLKPLTSYPSFIKTDDDMIYPKIFGTEKKPPISYPDIFIPSNTEIHKRITATGRQLAFPKLRFVIYGIRNGFILGERK